MKTNLASATGKTLDRSTREVPAFDVLRWTGRSSDACVIIPVINEGARIARVLERMTAVGVSGFADILIIDGGSTDGSLAHELLDRQGVAALLLKRGAGKLSAQLRCAYAFALDHGYEQIVTFDGNDKDDPSAIDKFILAIKSGYDFVQASRFKAGGESKNTPWKRWLAIRFIHAPLLSVASGFFWTDTTQGFRAYSRKLLVDSRLNIFRDQFGEYELLAYMNYRAPRLGYKCIELPSSRKYPASVDTPTKISLGGEWRIFKALIAVCRGAFNPQ